MIRPRQAADIGRLSFNMKEVTQALELGRRLLDSGKLHRARDLYRHVLGIYEGHPDALHMLGLISLRMNKYHEAVAFVSQALEQNPYSAVYYYHLGYIFGAAGEFAKAIKAYGAAIAINPTYAEAKNNLGLILYEQDRIEESISLFRQAIHARPDYTNAYYNLGNALQTQGCPRAAIEAYDQVLKILPDSAETRFNRSLALLLTARFEEGWPEYERRFRNLKDQTKSLVKEGIERWDGSAFFGKRLLVLAEQGIGDTLQFVRYLPLVKARGGTVLFEAIEPLMTLLENFNGIDQLLDRASTTASDTDFNLYVPLMSLPGIFNTGLDTIPASIPYIFPDPAKVQVWRQRLDKNSFNVGIVWAGRPTSQYVSARTCGLEHMALNLAGTPASKSAGSRSNSLAHFASLAQIPGIHLYGLQKGEGARQARELSPIMKVTNLGEEFKDFSDTAAVIANLDLVISVDTSVAHLAGAMGKPVWVLIPFVPDWRWMLVREDSPWYSSMRLFRQDRRGHWDEVFQRVARELYALVHQ